MLRTLRRWIKRNRARGAGPKGLEHLLDPGFYVATYPDVGASQEEARRHFLDHGWKEHRQGRAEFDPVLYLASRPALLATGGNAYAHHLDPAARAGEEPSRATRTLSTSEDLRATVAAGLFDETAYRTRHPEIRADQDALLHFLVVGVPAGSDPSGRFDTAYYATNNPDILEAGFEPFHHYLRTGRFEGRAGCIREAIERRFDAAFYAANNPDVVASGSDLLQHYLTVGHQEGRPGNVQEAIESLVVKGVFDPHFYAATYADIGDSGRAADHFTTCGWREHRQASPSFDPVTYLARHPDLYRENGNAYLDLARRHGLDTRSDGLPEAGVPNSADLREIQRLGLFDEGFYRARHPDLAPDRDALIDFMVAGIPAWADPSAAFDTTYYGLNNADVASSGMQPFLHYLHFGRAEERAALPPASIAGLEELIASSGFFDEDYYRAHTPAFARTSVGPLRHYVIGGHRSFQRPSAAFDPVPYLATHPFARQSTEPALVHFLRNRPPADLDGAGASAEPCWVPEPLVHAAPDQDVERERMRSVAFFAGFGFDQREGERREDGYVDEAVRMLAGRSFALAPRKGAPAASIIIPVYGQMAYVLACLDSLSRHESRFSAEIIVVDDATPKEAGTEALAEIPWIRYERRPANAGFIASCNHGAEIARGKVLVFLNSDTRLALSWLDELLGTFQAFPKAGLVGSKLYNEDGSLQEAGAIYWRNGNAWNYGRGAKGGDPAYSFARQVDYCSGASIAVPRSVFLEVGGFDRTYAPAYCEDSDLAFTLRQKGYEVWMQARSRVLHYEGKSHGRDLSSGGKAHQVANMHRFARKWAQVLSGQRGEGDQPARAANRGGRNRLLVLDAVTPTPDRDSGSLITVQMIKAFQELGWLVSFVPQTNYLYEPGYTDALQRLGVECFYAPFATSIDQVLDRTGPVDVVLAYRVEVLHPILETLRARLPLARILFHNVDLHYLREQREAELFRDGARRIKAARVRTEELGVILQADASIVHTPVERRIIEEQVPVRNIVEFPYIAPVQRSDVPFEARRDVMFLGGFAHTPNVDAVEFFLDEVWPLAIASLPADARFVVVGDKAPPALLARASDRVVFTGHVPELEPYFARARVFVAPLRYGAGIKGKVVQTLAHGVPSVCTPTAAEGMNLAHEKNVLIAEEGRSFADAVVRLYEKLDLWQAIQQAGYAFVEQNYSWSRCLELCNEVLGVAEETWLRREDASRAEKIAALIEAEGLAG